MLNMIKFKTLPVLEKGSRFPFEAKLSKDDLLYRIEHSRVSSELSVTPVSDKGHPTCLIIECEGRHIATYNEFTKTLYTNAREVFCQLEN